MDTVANVRLHRETHCKPLERFAHEKLRLRPLPTLPYDCAVVQPTSASGCCRVVLDTNRYTVPYLYASQQLTLKIYPDQLRLYHHEKLIATHLRWSRPPTGRAQSRPHPGTAGPSASAREQTFLQAFLSLGPRPISTRASCRKSGSMRHITSRRSLP